MLNVTGLTAYGRVQADRRRRRPDAAEHGAGDAHDTAPAHGDTSIIVDLSPQAKARMAAEKHEPSE